ncbi:MAG: hypothetical protein V1721_05440 [Pseudomonadota bacterium]
MKEIQNEQKDFKTLVRRYSKAHRPERDKAGDDAPACGGTGVSFESLYVNQEI